MERSDADLIWQQGEAAGGPDFRPQITTARLREDAFHRDAAQELRKARMREDIDYFAAKEARRQVRLATTDDVHEQRLAGVDARLKERIRAMSEGTGRTKEEIAEDELNPPWLLPIDLQVKRREARLRKEFAYVCDDGEGKRPRGLNTSPPTRCPVCERRTYYEDHVMQGYVKKLAARTLVLKAEEAIRSTSARMKSCLRLRFPARCPRAPPPVAPTKSTKLRVPLRHLLLQGNASANCRKHCDRLACTICKHCMYVRTYV